MLSLGLDTTGAWCTAALVNEARVIAAKSENIGRGHAERLAPMVQEIFRQADQTPANLDRIGVCTGPGSFTGLRVALSFAKGLALPHKTPTLGLSVLELLAFQADPNAQKKVVSISNVKRGEVCWAVYESSQEISPPRIQSIEEARAAITHISAELVVGDGAELIGLKSDHKIVSGPVLAWLAQHNDPGLYPASAFYSRAPDAKLPGGIDPKLTAHT